LYVIARMRLDKARKGRRALRKKGGRKEALCRLAVAVDVVLCRQR
jgi:hypothetical protein